jgi:hypothetical protein
MGDLSLSYIFGDRKAAYCAWVKDGFSILMDVNGDYVLLAQIDLGSCALNGHS